ncbi:MAG TPA: hypothetical protein VES93_10075 [Ornithinibacter sp.]|nr:hypothetical protein [Ornithinibacter sp.]
MSHAALHSARPARSTHIDRVVTTQRWTIGVLALATLLLTGYLLLLVSTTWLLAATWSGLTRDAVSLDLVSIARDVLPVLLVGWCTGLAASAALGRGEALGARTAGILAGVVGAVAAAVVLSLTDLL